MQRSVRKINERKNMYIINIEYYDKEELIDYVVH